MASSKKYILLLCMVVAILYGQTLWFSYVWDDMALLVHSTRIREGILSWKVVSGPILPDSHYFRPLVMSTWVLESKYFDLNPSISHAINVMAHAIIVLLTFFITNIITKNSRIAFLASLLYAIHPCLAESVAWVSGRFDLFATMFLLTSCLIALKNPIGANRGIASMAVSLFCLASMLSKETGVLFPAFLLLLTASIEVEKNSTWKSTAIGIWRNYRTYFIAFFVAFITYAALRRSGLGESVYSDFGINQFTNSLLNYEPWTRATSFYTYMSLMPFNSISPRHDMLYELQSHRQNVIAVATSLILPILIICFALKKTRPAIIGLGFYIGIIPVIGLFKVLNGETIGSERFLSLPLVFATIAIAVFLFSIQAKISKKNLRAFQASKILLLGWVCIASIVTFTVTSMWASDLKLWSWQYSVNDKNELIRTIYLDSLSAQKTEPADQLFLSEIQKIRTNYGELPVDVQVVYAKFLLERQDSAALPVLAKLLHEFPKNWLAKYGGGTGEQSFKITYSGILVNYAQALVVFTGDTAPAENVLNYAKKLVTPGIEYTVDQVLIATKILDGNFSDANTLYKKSQENFQAYNGRRLDGSMETLIREGCKSKVESKESCAEKLNIFKSISDGEYK